MPALADPDPVLPGVITMKDALRAGLTPDQVRHRVRSGRWTRIGRGAYLPSAALESATNPFERAALTHRAWVTAAAQRHPGAVIGYHSAALIHGLPLWGRTPSVASLIVPASHWTGSRGAVRFRSTPLPSEEIRTLGDLAVTSIARTWCDVARTSRLATALAMGDAALRAGSVTASDMAVAVDAARRLKGVGRAERAVVHLSALRETPLESASWSYFVRHRLPLPAMQVVIVDAGGHFIARVDYLWEAFGLVGECDGRIKYADSRALYDEKRREDAIRQLGFNVLRWGSAELMSDQLARRIRILTRA